MIGVYGFDPVPHSLVFSINIRGICDKNYNPISVVREPTKTIIHIKYNPGEPNTLLIEKLKLNTYYAH